LYDTGIFVFGSYLARGTRVTGHFAVPIWPRVSPQKIRIAATLMIVMALAVAELLPPKGNVFLICHSSNRRSGTCSG
jgi:hypothetical protein